ncbi:hypothetical protein [Treponema endosymbiont of Eucomonympha sp.]|uniref:hypothetical protein n=1 Tax=Treponema endosymbiont of Eucomonympha sp. TaxID=1580831 RepID=UPI0007802F17|nr:hypothetical protein [Treponema endosymbiont of Eucomonympha sp.]
MNKTRNTVLGIVSALALTAGAGFALYSCDGFAAPADQAAGAEADAGRQVIKSPSDYKIRGPKGWVDYVFSKDDIRNLDKDYVLGTDRTAHVKRYFRYTNDNLRKKLEAGGITITDYYSTSKAGEWCWVEFNLKEITEIKSAY